jgi:SAM-dependent methyltransferase
MFQSMDLPDTQFQCLTMIPVVKKPPQGGSIIECEGAYSALAPEYEGDDHSTIAEFHRLTKSEIALNASELREAATFFSTGRWLVAGVGPGSNVEDFISATGSCPSRLEALDISPQMIELAKAAHLPFSGYNSGDVREFAAKNPRSWNCVLALLADPYLDESGLDALCKLVAPGGALVLSTPTALWAGLIRPTHMPNTSSFNLRDGSTRTAPSYCWDLPELSNAVTKRGFKPIWLRSVSLSAKNCRSKINAQALKKVETNTLALLSLAIFQSI